MLLVYITFLLSVCRMSLTSNGPIIKAPAGKLRGWERVSRGGRVYQAWTRVPFAEPPVGKLRLKAPLPAKKWKGVYDATRDMPYCMQKPFPIFFIPKFNNTEDCLYLNVYRPKEPANKSMPVIIFLFGGANVKGNVGRRWNADYLMDEDLVLVEPNFRLNGFGLLSLGDNVIPGNYMYKDMVLALKWMKTNIASFGGNPNQLILLGESSGASATQFLFNSPLSRDLVAGGLSSSGTMYHLEMFPLDGRVQNNSWNIIRSVGCERKTSQEILSCLQKIDAYELLFASIAQTTTPVHVSMGLVVEPRDVQDAFMTEEDQYFNTSKHPWMNTLAEGELSTYDISLRLGPVFVENAYVDINKHLTDFLSRIFSDTTLVEEKVKKIVDRYFAEEKTVANFSMALARMYADAGLTYSALYNSLHHKGPVWMSYLEYKKDQNVLVAYPYDLAGHAMDFDFYFNRTAQYTWSVPESRRDMIVSKRLIRYLINFAYNLNPAPSGSPSAWPQFRGQEILRIKADKDFLGDSTFMEELMDLCRFWEDIIGW